MPNNRSLKDSRGRGLFDSQLRGLALRKAENVISRSRKRLNEMDAIDGGEYRRCSGALQLQTALTALAGGIERKDWELVGDAFCMVEHVELLLRIGEEKLCKS